MKYKVERPPLTGNFFLPSKESLVELKPGNLVKIMIRHEEEGVERMWVKIIQQQDISEWTGVLDNDPVGEKMSGLLKAGDIVIFHPLDIIQIWDDKKITNWEFKEAINARVFTTPEIASGIKPVLFAIHELDGDWQFLPSEKTEDKNAIFIPLRYLIENDNTLSELGNLPVGWHAKRKSIEDSWIRESEK
ncbi:MAG: hypothetical protein V4519_01210 [Patescibacteria group bacterium]